MLRLLARFILGVTCMLTGASLAFGQSSQYESVGQGWEIETKQADPFDTTSREIVSIQKGNFYFDCESMVFATDDYLTSIEKDLDAQIQFKIDSNAISRKEGRWGYDWSSSRSFFMVPITAQEVLQMKRGATLLAAGNAFSRGWTTRELDLAGFTNAYTQMCE